MSGLPLPRDAVAAVVDGRACASRVPMLIHFWVLDPPRFGEREAELRALLGRYPMDAQMIPVNMPQLFAAPEDDPDYRWADYPDPYQCRQVALDERVAVADWAQLDGILARFPDPQYKSLFRGAPPPDCRYRLAYWWYWLFERHWSWRGMTQALTDYMLFPQVVHHTFRALTEFYIRVIERAHTELGADGIMLSDDLGTQRSLFFSPSVFDTFFAPYYGELIETAHGLGMHVWLHACGRIEPLLPRLIDLGVDVIHPIQKHTMDYSQIARDYGRDITIWAGFDVQQVLPRGTPGQVRQELRLLCDAFRQPNGRLLLGAGNAIHEDCSLANLKALLDEAVTYGATVGGRARDDRDSCGHAR